MDDKDQRILAAAERHFALNGYEGTKLAAVARDAGVAVGTIYLRFADKSDLLRGVLGRIEDRFVAAMQTPEVRSAPWPGRFRGVFAAVFEQARREPHLTPLMPLSRYAVSDGWHPGHTIRSAIADHVRSGQAAGVIRSDLDPALIAAIAYGMVEGALVTMPADAAGANDLPGILAQAAEAWLSAHSDGCQPPAPGTAPRSPRGPHP